MLKLQKPINRPSKPRERFDFKFSNFQALQVPKGWDRLFVSLVSAESGKTIAKLGKALVKNGSCLWSETISESFHISRYDSSKAYEDCPVKFVVSTGSTRSNNTLGEAIINMAQYAGSRTSAAVSQPLRKCSYGTNFQVKIQRVTLPRSKIRDEGSKSSDSQEKVEGVDHFCVESKAHRSNDSSGNSTNKLPREELATSSHPLKLDSEIASETRTAIINSFSSLEGSYERENSSVENAFKSEEYSSDERRGGGSSGPDLLRPDHYSVDGDSPSTQSYLDSRVHLRENFHNEAAVSRWSTSNVSSSRNLLEAAEDSIEELRAEAKMWERNARKLMIDLDLSRKDFSDLSKNQAELGVELSAAYAERDGLRRQVEEVKEEFRQSTTNKATREAPIVQSRSLQKELENEMKYQQHLNDELGQQLKQSQESNVELVSVLQELEETTERQRIEIENLSSLKLNFMHLQNSMERSSEENRNLLIQLGQLQESEKNLKSEIQLLDEALRDKTDELEKERKSNREILSQVEREYNCKMLLKQKEITSLEGKLSDCIRKDEELNGNGEDDVNLMREIESLREKVRELEKDCTELTDENLELLFKLKGSNKTDIRKCSSFESMTSEHPASCRSEESEVSDPKDQVSNMEEDFKVEVKIDGFESSLHFAEILEQMDIAFHFLVKPCYGRFSGESETSEDYLHRLMISDKVDTTRMSVEYIRSLLHELNKLLQMRIAESEECISDLEAQVDQLKDEKRGCLQEMENHKSSATSLQDEIRKLKDETDIQILNLRQESEDKRKQWLGAQEECEYLKKENKTLQASAMSSVLKTTEHQNLNAELKRENHELHERSSELVHQLSEMEKSLSDCTKKIDSLQSHLTSAQDDFVLRENHLKSELDALVEHNSYQKEKVAEDEGLRRLLLKKTTEFQSLQKEVESLRKQLSDSHEERERIFVEVSSLVAEKAELQASLQDIKWEAESTKNELNAALEESESKLQELTDQQAASNQSRERLAADYERILKLVANYRKVEEKLKTDLNDIELKHTISDYERHQLTSSLKVQLQSISDLREEVSILKNDLKEYKLDKGKLELALHTISRDYEELKAEKISLSEKICLFEDIMCEFEECKRNKSCLEKKLLEIEKDLSAKEILSIQNKDLKNEVAEMKRLNVQFQQKMYRLEVEKEECLKKVEALEDNLKLMEERNSIHKEGAHNYHKFHDQDPHVVSGDNLTKKELLENEFSEGQDANDDNRFLHERQKKLGGMVARERYERTKSSLETELRDLRERYLQMSLKYAEVEEQREDLVMKLRATRTKKRWFS